ncbi:MAG: hypothetical protein CML13_15975 [Puniceicoccaceae bacterium]|nr:hypothetical protein [Puniceicoccaceae bacterium]
MSGAGRSSKNLAIAETGEQAKNDDNAIVNNMILLFIILYLFDFVFIEGNTFFNFGVRFYATHLNDDEQAEKHVLRS